MHEASTPVQVRFKSGMLVQGEFNTAGIDDGGGPKLALRNVQVLESSPQVPPLHGRIMAQGRRESDDYRVGSGAGAGLVDAEDRG
jgi:hypothetical protein